MNREISSTSCPIVSHPRNCVYLIGARNNRWTLDGENGLNFTQGPPQAGSRFSFTTTDTAGCSCEQIIDETGVGRGHERFGCSTSVLNDWTKHRDAP